jgi:hypothetical protein
MHIDNNDSAYIDGAKVIENAKQIMYASYQYWILDYDGRIWTNEPEPIRCLIAPIPFVRMYCNPFDENTFAVGEDNITYKYMQHNGNLGHFVQIGKDIKHVAEAYKKTYILYENGCVKDIADVSGGLRTVGISQIYMDWANTYYITVDDVLIDINRRPVLKNIYKVYGCDYNVYAIDYNKTLWARGDNNRGQLGIGHRDEVWEFTRITENVEQVECLVYNTFMLDVDGNLWCSGNNSELVNTFRQVFSKVREVKCIVNCCYIITEDDILYKYGDDDEGEADFNYTIDPANFVQIAENVKTLANCEPKPEDQPFSKSARNTP